MAQTQNPAASQTTRPKITLVADQLLQVAFLPQLLLGFKPQNSVVFLLLHRSKVVRLARLDWHESSSVNQMRSAMETTISASQVDEAYLIGYANLPQIADFLLSFGQAVCGIEIVGRFALGGEKIWSAECCCANCVAGIGMELAEVAGNQQNTVTKLAAGSEPTRQQLIKKLSGPPQEFLLPIVNEQILAAERLVGYTDSQISAWFKTTMRKLVAGCSLEKWPNNDFTVSNETAFLLAAALKNVKVQKLSLSLISDQNAHYLSKIWFSVAQLVPPGWQVEVLSQLAIASWLSGRGSLLTISWQIIREQHEDAVDDLVVPVIDYIIEHSIHPSQWQKIRQPLLGESPGKAA